MGQCVQKQVISPRKLDFDDINSKLNLYKQPLTDEIHRMHMLSVLCKSESEYCMIKDNKYSSIVLMKKYAQTIERIMLLQKILKDIDDSNNSFAIRHSKKLQMIREIESILKEKENCLYKNNINEIIDQDPKVMRKITKSLLSFSTNDADVEAELDQSFVNKSVGPIGIRRKYIRTEFKTSDIV